MQKIIMVTAALLVSLALAACSGGGDATAPAETTTESGTGTTGDGTSATPPTLVTTTCTPAPTLASRYARVFKGCDSAGVAQYYDITECVRDNTTGLIWQGQTPAGTGLRANDQYKTNFDSTTALQKWTGSAYVAPTQAEVDASTNSIGFKNAVNATNLCGSGAWRLPTKDELLGIVKINPAAPMIDTDWFPNTPQYSVYWTSSPYAGSADATWFVYFGAGYAGNGNRDYHYGSNTLVRLVR